jgi:eukaryotic-like serine/threonine-protein kinase
MQLIGLIADRFVLERPAAAGGMGVVYRALDRASGATVALKLAADGGEKLRARALAEADALAALDHPAIVRLIDHGLAPDGRPFIAMEWLEGEDLGARLLRAPLTAGEAALLGARVASALNAAHARGIVHRDLKPENLFLPGREVEQVKLVDFGIAHFPRAGPRLTATGAIFGTPAYMAPEQARGERDIGPAADQFALGAVLFECLAGRPAFSGGSPFAVLGKVLLDEPPRIDALRADLPPALAELVACLLSKEPAERPAAAAALSALLPELEGAVGPGQAPAAIAITSDELRLACVLLIRLAPKLTPAAGVRHALEAGGTSAAATLGPTLPDSGAPASILDDRSALEHLRALVGPRGGRVDCLADGGLVAFWLGPGVPRDQAARAARAALRVRQRLPGAALSPWPAA